MKEQNSIQDEKTFCKFQETRFRIDSCLSLITTITFHQKHYYCNISNVLIGSKASFLTPLLIISRTR